MYIRVFSELSGQLRYASQKRVLIEVALIKLTRPQMEPDLDAILERLKDLEQRLEEGIPAQAGSWGGAGAGTWPGQAPGSLAGEYPPGQPGAGTWPGQAPGSPSGAYPAGQPGPGAGTWPGQMPGSRPGESPAGQSGPMPPAVPVQPERVAIPRAQLEDLNQVRQDWGKIIRDLGGAVRPAFRDTVLEPSGDGCLTIVFAGPDSYAIGSRATVIGMLENYVKEHYGKELYFKVRMKNTGERLDTVYVSDEELKQAIHMEITMEDETS